MVFFFVSSIVFFKAFGAYDVEYVEYVEYVEDDVLFES